MNRIKYLSLLMLMVFGISFVNAQENEIDPVITLERTACHGSCPIYTVTILEDGAVIYEGEDFVSVTGKQTGDIAPEIVASIVEAFVDAGYFDWDESYETQTVSDLPTVITSVTDNGTTHRIVRYTGDYTAPLALPFLEQWIDEMAHTTLWTGVQPDLSGFSNGTDTPLITLQQGPNFGSGPVYNIAAYEDSTVVYTGIANVNEIGVHIFQTDAAIITSIAQNAQLSGYFNWQDSYEERIITDQATVITSIRWADQIKRIVRYDGDPNAPIGIVRIEENIAQLVTDLTG
jgi:hypothetical protein